MFAPADDVRLAIGRALERGQMQGVLARALARLWAPLSARSLACPLSPPLVTAPPRVAIIAVGGSTLGGSGKTPLAIACARELARAGARVAFVGHAYRATPERPRVVTPDDPLPLVGEEALVAAAALAPHGVPIIVAKTRAAAVSHAATHGDVIVIDGVVQTRPRASLSLLAVDARAPWGSAAVPPRGDLRAPIESLLSCTDHVVKVGEDVDIDSPLSARVTSRGAWIEGTLWDWPRLCGAPLPLVLATARPTRIITMLARRGIHPSPVILLPDHARPTPETLRRLTTQLTSHPPSRHRYPPSRRPPVVLMDAKTAATLGTEPWPGAAPRPAIIDHTLALSPAVRDLLLPWSPRA